MAEPAIRLSGINKRFGAVHANRDIDLEIKRGTIHGIIGENGAGKSTLMSILYGFYQADSGEIRIGGNVANIATPNDAIAAGIGMVHQHFMLVHNFTVLENVMLGAEGAALLKSGIASARAELRRLETEYGLEVDPDALIEELPVGLQQRVEILKALYRGADILILDEPTVVLTPAVAVHLFRILGMLKDQGKTVVLITHKLREIMAITDSVSVMRQGQMVATRRTADTTVGELAELMVGRRVLLRVEKGEAQPGEVKLSVSGLTVKDSRGVTMVDDVSFELRAGEIVGIAGVAGNGQSELIEAIAGIRRAERGTVLLDGRPIDVSGTADPAELRARRLAHVPEDRHHVGLVLAREIERDPGVLLVGQPTRGVDVGAIEFIHKRLIAMRDAGKAVLLVSVELDEIRSLSDRILVMFDGRIVGERDGEAGEGELGLLMAGVERQEAAE